MELTVDSIPPEPTSDNGAEPETTEDILNSNTKTIFITIWMFLDGFVQLCGVAQRAEPVIIALPADIAPPVAIARVETNTNTTSLAESEVTSYQKRATTVTRAVCKAMRHFMSNHRPTDSKRMLAKLIDDDSTQAAQMFRMEDAAISELAEHIGEEHAIFSKWATTGTSVDQAYHMYPESGVLNADAFVLFIARLVDGLHRHAKGEQGRPEPRRHCGHVVDDVLASGIESTITSKSEIAEISDEWHANLFAPVEVRQGSSYNNKYDAEVKLIKRCRKIQCTQPNCGFQWGLTIRDSLVQAYLFGSNFSIASENMDIQVIRLFVNWSYTEDYRLGYDSTIKRCMTSDARRLHLGGDPSPSLSTAWTLESSTGIQQNQFPQHSHSRPCLHRQYVTGLTSLPVTKVNSIQELIIVVKDAMKAYSEFNKIIDIVHRNLTPDAICFHYLEGGRVKGMLADFAQSYNSKLCAVDKEKNIGIPLPFMSVSIIERNSNPITKTEAKKSTVELVQEAGRKFWVSVPRNNRTFLDSEANFSRILDRSNKHVPGYKMLWSLLKDLRAALIENSGYNEDCLALKYAIKYVGSLAQPTAKQRISCW
ncbi:hypothetical protein BX661DRAFT_214608 [Kickxella alabastrina]|uniref:uncharacterized protein n=1 Tax=Kickxella alabastrina TaxID=61397 RepID=UPI00221F26D2|nr:uncharacterized protein BX661DRAFT_214608 [Kickxella alabastrina]KAI7825532.1 hypothetical protein BX661DRAFT_214608 [Kickxella alabastrina]